MRREKVSAVMHYKTQDKEEEQKVDTPTNMKHAYSSNADRCKQDCPARACHKVL
jgi:hypothetical protein